VDRSARLAVSFRLALLKSRREVAIATRNSGMEVVGPTSRWATTSLTTQPSQRLGVAHCSGVSVTRVSAKARRSVAMTAKGSS